MDAGERAGPCASPCNSQLGGFAHGGNLTVNAVIALLASTASCMSGLLSRERREQTAALRARDVGADNDH
ncbi:hypothetical protein [Streptomyces sp. WMMC940]|uniref:hypothetical protein n=1 Tax=Streptomyces sp. WMMC940 TaxID=3015153 RepID=UPI0022B69B41|nr:hypothetical protein [Streptomyces sp. WMMC940]MCZ7456887.1 hypothetical protein [Streptomyces sp. WMMC940]